MSDVYIPSFFSDDPKSGALTYEQLQARRKIAAALATRNRGYPKNIGEGLTALGEGFADAYMDRRARRDEEAYRTRTDAQIREALTPGAAAAAPAAPAAPAVPSAGPGPMSPDIDPFGGGPQAQAAPAAMDAMALATPADIPAEPKQKFPELSPEVAARLPKMPIPELKRRLARAEGTISEPDPYRVVGERNLRGDYPYGKYAVMGERIPEWSKQYLGKEMTPQQFLDDDKAQEEIASARAGYYQDKYGPNGAAAAWFAGENGMNDPKRMHTLGRHVDEYVKRFNIPLVDRDQVAASVGGGAAPPVQLASAGDPRAAIAGAMAQGPQGPMQPTPVPQQQQQPPGPPPVPPQQIAQAPVGTPVPSAMAPPQGEPREPRPLPMDDQERKIRALIASNPNDPRVQALGAVADRLAEERKFKDTRNVEKWKLDLSDYHKQRDPSYQAGLEKAQRDAADAARQRQLEISRGNVPQAVIDKKLEASEKAVAPLREASSAINQVEELLDRGMFTGLTGKLDLATAKAKAALGFPPDPRIAATEQFTASIKPITAAARAALVGGANISDKDLAAAEAAAGGDITLTEDGIRNIMKSLRTLQLQTAMHHQKVLSTAAGGDTAALTTLNGLYGLPMENILSPKHPAVKRLLENADNEHERGLFDSAFHTPGLATKIIVRARPRQ